MSANDTEHSALEGVSRETLARLNRYLEILEKWSGTVNLVSRKSLGQAWQRHIRDSAQLLPILERSRGTSIRSWCDMGSGAGFPGMVVALLARDLRPEIHVTLVESDSRKAAFLHHVAGVLAIPVTVANARVESIAGLSADVISARALAPLERLLALAYPHLAPGGLCLFPKGAGWRDELKPTLAGWQYRLQEYPSATDANGTILGIEGLSRV